MSQNIVILTERKGTQFTSSVLQQFHDDTYDFDSENGFALAFGMLHYPTQSLENDIFEVSVVQ